MKGGGGREEGDFILDPEFEGTVAIKRGGLARHKEWGTLLDIGSDST